MRPRTDSGELDNNIILSLMCQLPCWQNESNTKCDIGCFMHINNYNSVVVIIKTNFFEILKSHCKEN